jgi:hypothetical protein
MPIFRPFDSPSAQGPEGIFTAGARSRAAALLELFLSVLKYLRQVKKKRFC